MLLVRVRDAYRTTAANTNANGTSTHTHSVLDGNFTRDLTTHLYEVFSQWPDPGVFLSMNGYYLLVGTEAEPLAVCAHNRVGCGGVRRVAVWRVHLFRRPHSPFFLCALHPLLFSCAPLCVAGGSPISRPAEHAAHHLLQHGRLQLRCSDH